MNAYFRRQLTDYVEYHRDPWNCAAHVLGIILLFLGAILPLTMWPISALGVHTTLGVLLALPVLIYWVTLDAVIGLALVAAAVLLFATATLIVDHVSLAGVWEITLVLLVVGVGSQIVGHQLFERRKASMADHPIHLLLGPPFVMAKLFIAFGFRDDLAEIIGPAESAAPDASSVSGKLR
jgi:uncharacterized membrane protein YGL010W